MSGLPVELVLERSGGAFHLSETRPLRVMELQLFRVTRVWVLIHFFAPPGFVRSGAATYSVLFL